MREYWPGVIPLNNAPVINSIATAKIVIANKRNKRNQLQGAIIILYWNSPGKLAQLPDFSGFWSHFICRRSRSQRRSSTDRWNRIGKAKSNTNDIVGVKPDPAIPSPA